MRVRVGVGVTVGWSWGYMTEVEKRWLKSSYFSTFTEALARVVRREAACTRPYLQSGALVSPISETHGFRPTRRSLAALPLKVESSYFRANVSLLVSSIQCRLCSPPARPRSLHHKPHGSFLVGCSEAQRSVSAVLVVSTAVSKACVFEGSGV